MLKKFLEWFWFRKHHRYKDKKFSPKIIKIRGLRTFLTDHVGSPGSRESISIILPWENYDYSWRWPWRKRNYW